LYQIGEVVVMATQDEKISDNRRRLFKALSAAPVVATLRPGEALATSSAIQCAANPMPIADTKYYLNTTQGCTNSDTGVDCHAYLQRMFWNPGVTDPLDPLYAHWAKVFIVETQGLPSGSAVSVYWTVVDGQRGSTIGISAAAGVNVVTRSGDQLFFYGSDGTSFLTVDGAMGLFLAIGGPDDPNDPMGWTASAVWPEEQDTANNVLGGSCLTSFPASGGFTLADS
jgi:hypothetical protein